MTSRRSLYQKIRDQAEEINFLRETLYLASGGTLEPLEILPFEKTGKTPSDMFLKNLFTWSE